MIKNRYVLGLDVSTKTIGISLFEIQGSKLKLILLHHVTPVVKPRPASKMEELFEKSNLFETSSFWPSKLEHKVLKSKVNE